MRRIVTEAVAGFETPRLKLFADHTAWRTVFPDTVTDPPAGYVAVVAEGDRLQPRKVYPVRVGRAVVSAQEAFLHTVCARKVALVPSFFLKVTVQKGSVIVVSWFELHGPPL